MPTVSYRLDEQVKNQLDQLSSEHESKQEFFSEMIKCYEIHKKDEPEIDFSSINDIESSLKKAIADSYKAIVYYLQSSTMRMKQQLKEVEQQKQEVEKYTISKDNEVEDLKNKHNEDLLKLQNRYEDLSVQYSELKKDYRNLNNDKTKLDNEIETLRASAENVKTYIAENEKLHKELKRLQDIEKLNNKTELERENLKSQLLEARQNIQELKKIEAELIQIDKSYSKIEFEKENLQLQLLDMKKELDKNSKLYDENIQLKTEIRLLREESKKST